MMGLSKYENESRPWGAFERFTLNEPTTVKILTLNPGRKLSLQTHARRDEFWHVIGGSGFVVIGNETREAHLGDEFRIPRGTRHRAEGGVESLLILEIAFGEFDENDEVRIEDDYGRV